MRRTLTAVGSGLLFGIGLVISGMTDPRNVIGFLDVTGAWNPSLGAVMLGAIGVHALALRFYRRGSVLGAAEGEVVSWNAIDPKVVIGSAIFGVGWGIAGYCPGPAIVSLGFGAGSAWTFVGAMVAGVLLADVLVTSRAPQAAMPGAAPTC
jgi:uncharacterized protein